MLRKGDLWDIASGVSHFGKQALVMAKFVALGIDDLHVFRHPKKHVYTRILNSSVE